MQPTKPIQKNGRLRQERLQRHWRQADLAEQLGTTELTVRRWERGSQKPSAYFRLKLCALFGKSAQDLGFVAQAQNSPPPDDMRKEESASGKMTDVFPVLLWNVPYSRNPFFTGREATLDQLHELLNHERQERILALTQSLAVSGLGGIGKTQIALEYAYRYASAYAAVFWINAETSQTLLSSFVTVAEVLTLPEHKEHDLALIVRVVMQWLSCHRDWLLIFDNVEDLDQLKPFLPPSRLGSLLLTTRLQALGTIARPIVVGPMHLEESLTFLLQRARILTPDASLSSISSADFLTAQAVVDLLGNLPLALDQAGAYIEETGCDLVRYYKLYQEHSGILLNRRGGSTGDNHPSSVAATVSFSLRQVEARSPAAADLLRLCAFLSPDAIPQELFLPAVGVAPASSLVFDALQWDEALAVLRRYSLITRHADTDLLSVHRLVQAVLKSQMDQTTYRHWARQAIQMVSWAFPEVELLTTWSQCQRLLPHALACAALIEEEQVLSEDAGRLLHRMGTYLLEWAQYAQAETYLARGHVIRVHLLGSEHPAVAESLNHLAEIAYYKGQYREAERLHQQALRIREQQLGPTHSEVATSLNNLAGVYWIQGRYQEAEPLYRLALQIREEALGCDHLDVAETLQNLAYLFFDQERYLEAEPLYERSLKICQQILGPDHAYLTTILNNLGRLYHAQGKYAEAKRLYHQAKTLGEHALTTQHPYYAITLSNLARLACVEGEWAQAQEWYQQALQIRENVFGPENPRTAQSLHDLATLYHELGQVDQALHLYQQALAIREKVLRPDHPDIAETLHHFAVLRETQDYLQEAVSLYQRTLSIREPVLGALHPKTQETRTAYDALLLRIAENQPSYERDSLAERCEVEQVGNSAGSEGE